MSYIFPRRVLRPGDVLDPQELTEDITPAADRVSGKLNMHNFDQGVASTIVVDGEAYYQIARYQKSVDIQWTEAATPGPPWGNPDAGYATTTDMAMVQNNFEWQALIDGTGASTQVSMTTGQSVLWINAYAQYIWWGFSNPTGGVAPGGAYHANDALNIPCNLQFALRVNGNIISETVTGIDDLTYRASIPVKPKSTRSASSILPGPQDIRGPQVCALGPPCLPIRIGACVPCVPGPQLVELVVRRVPFITDEQVVQYSTFDKIAVYARQVVVVEMKAYPIDSVGPAETTAPALETEDTLNQAALYTNRVQPIIAAYNDVQEGSLARGALMHYHLPSAVLQTAQKLYDASSFGGWLFNNYYPGTNPALRDTVTTNYYSGTQAGPTGGWGLIGGGLSGIRVNNIDVSTPRKILVLGNVQVRNISGSSFKPSGGGLPPLEQGAFNAFALFQLMTQNNTASPTSWNSVTESIGMVNNFVWWTGSFIDFAREFVEVHLMAVIDLTVPQATPLNVAIFGGVANTGTECDVLRGSLIAISMRK
jgi:hypothetical protein